MLERARADVAVLAHALVGIRAVINPEKPTAYSYVTGSKLIPLGVILVLAIIPDAVLLWLLLPQTLWWLALILNALEIWACVWFFGLYGTMVRSPHELSPEKVLFRNGILHSVEIDPRSIGEMRELGIVRRAKLPLNRGDHCAVLAFGGVPLVEISFKVPGLECRSGSQPKRNVERLFVASDVPGALVSALRDLARGK